MLNLPDCTQYTKHRSNQRREHLTAEHIIEYSALQGRPSTITTQATPYVEPPPKMHSSSVMIMASEKTSCTV